MTEVRLGEATTKSVTCQHRAVRHRDGLMSAMGRKLPLANERSQPSEDAKFRVSSCIGRVARRRGELRGNRGKLRETAKAFGKSKAVPTPLLFTKETAKSSRFCSGGEGWIRTSVRLRGQIYSLLPLTTRPPLHEGRNLQAGAPCGGAPMLCQRGNALRNGRCRSPLLLRYGRSNSQAALGSSTIGAGEGNRTLVVSLEGFCSTIELHPLELGAMQSGAFGVNRLQA